MAVFAEDREIPNVGHNCSGLTGRLLFRGLSASHQSCMISLRIIIQLYPLFEHDLFRKPVPTFLDHALEVTARCKRRDVEGRRRAPHHAALCPPPAPPRLSTHCPLSAA